ncbi:MAG: AMP-binding protein [Bacteroidales bacterium]|nr:AMP-binding protein [Bacteroidales bacterium]
MKHPDFKPVPRKQPDPHYLGKFEKVVKQYWNDAAICNYGGKEYSYGEVAAIIEKTHMILEASGVKKGDKVTLCARNTAEWAISFLAINTYEAVVVPLLADFLPESINHLVDHSDSVALFSDDDIWPKLDIAQMPKVKTVVNINNFSLFHADSKVEKAYQNLDQDFAAKYPKGFGPADVHYPVDNAKDLAVINYTSGTTSAPKGVMLRYECFSATIDYGHRYLPNFHGDKIVSMLPMGHIYGLTYEFLYPLCGGVCVYYLGKTPSPSLLLKAMKDVKPYIVITVPLVMEKVFKSGVAPALKKLGILTKLPILSGVIYRAAGKKLMEAFGGNIRYFIMGGAALNPKVETAFKKMELPYTVGYGMTEAAPLLAFRCWWEYAPGSCGQAVDCAEVRIDSEDPHGIAGEILAKGTNICSGYYKYPEADSAVFTADGYLHTGDLGTIDKDGNIFIRGRSKTMFLSANGQNIYPEELEAVINSRPYVSESVVVDRGGKLVALVFLDQKAIDDAKLTPETVSDIPEDIRRAANKQLPMYSQIAKVELVTVPFEKTPKMSIKRFLYS